MRYEIRARHDALADPMVLISTDDLDRALRYLADFTDLLPNMNVWGYDTQEFKRLETPVTDAP